MLLQVIKNAFYCFSKSKNKDIIVVKRLKPQYLEKHNLSELVNEICLKTEFLPNDRRLYERIYCIVNNINILPICKNEQCANTVKFQGGRYADFCCVRCTNTSELTKTKIKTTNLSRLGVETPFKSERCKELMRQSHLINYGVENVSQSPIIKEKKRQKALEVYGVESVFQSEIVRNNYKKKLIEKYGEDNPQKVKSIKEKTQITRKLIYYNRLLNSELFNSSFEILFSFEDYINNPKKKCKFKCKGCGNIIQTSFNLNNLPRCKVCNPIGITKSKPEKEIVDDIANIYDGEIFRNVNTILDRKKELDIYIKDLNLAIEFNGIYWHREQLGKIDRHTHLNKTIECNSKGIKLIHIFEDEWYNSKDKISNIIKFEILKESVDVEYEICNLNKDQTDLFLDNNHLEGKCEFDKSYGLIVDNILTSILVIKNNSIIRFGNKIGNFNQKLIEYLINYTTTIKSTLRLDLRFYNHTDIQFFNNLGFIKVKKVEPIPWFIARVRHGGQVLNRFKTIEEILDYKQITELPNIDKIWDCGYLELSR